ncbi:hypothetical protein [Variovorax sp. LT1R16]
MLELDKLNEFTESHGQLQRGRGLVTGSIALYAAHYAFLDPLFGRLSR